MISAVAQQFSLCGVDGDHLAGAEPSLLDDGGVVELDGADLGAEGEDAVRR